MAGTVGGGIKTRDKNLARDPDHYRKIGRKGGQNGKTGSFATNRELARIAGRKGGQISKRGPAKEKTWPNISGASGSTSSTPKTEIQSAPLSSTSEASNGSDSTRKTSSFLASVRRRFGA